MQPDKHKQEIFVMSQVIQQASLLDIIALKHNVDNIPNTYARGTKRINYMFGTKRVLKYCVTCGITPFGLGYQSDHRAIFARLDISKILDSEMHPAESGAQHLLISATPNERKLFLQELHSHYKAQTLYNRLNKLWQTS
jgi:hypothetical protein